MARDLAIDYNTGDLIVSARNDIGLRNGSQVVEQRIRVRLRIFQGEWHLDPTNGSLGSRLHDVVRLPVERAVQEIPLVIREALEPMDDIHVHSVTAKQSLTDPRNIDVVIAYTHIEPGEEAGDATTLATTVTVAE